MGRLCCKSRKLQGHEFFAKTRSGKQSPIRTDAIAVSKSPVSLTLGDEVPHVFTRKPRLRPLEFLVIGAKRLLPPASRIRAEMLQGFRPERTLRSRSWAMSASLIGHSGSPSVNYCITRATTQLLNTNGRSKRTCELTSSIVPRGTSFHHWVDLEFPPIAFDPARYSCHCGFPGPSELGAVSPDAMHNHGQPSCQSTIAFFIPRRLAICIAQALSQDHFFDHNML